MKRNIRAEHVGSLLRPPELLHARAAQLPPEELRVLEDRGIRDAIQKQRDIGLDILSDGEMRRGSWLTDMAEAVEGFVTQKVMLDWKGPGGGHEASTANAVGAKLRKIRKLTGHEIPLLQSVAPGEFKITLPAPSNFMLASYKPGLTDAFYPTHADLLRDLIEIVRDDVQWLVNEDVTYIQFDAPYYSHYLNGALPAADLDAAIAADNSALAAIPRDKVTIAMHVCRGNSRSRWYSEGGYDAIAEKLFGTLDVERFLLEYDNERSGGFAPLKHVPRGKTVVLGPITTKQPALESEDVLRRRIDEASRYVPLENLALSPQCGFASVAAGNLISVVDQWRKLELVAKTARAVWG